MSDSPLNHRLAAILAADAVGYSRLMAVDDRATVAALDAARAVFREQIEAQQGRIVDMAGDSVLAVFGTAAGAVAAALAIQAQLRLLGDAERQGRRMDFRLGVHLGDVIEKSDGSVYGDGVNIAARLQSLAEPGAVMVSEAVHSAVRGRVSAGWVDAGNQLIKNMPYPVRAFRAEAAAPSAAEAPPPTANERPSIAVLPFKVLSDDPRVGFLADALVEDVIALLARVPGFVLISPSSSFVFRGREAGAAAIARELGVRYIVEGSVRALGGPLRVSTQLIEAASARVLWSGRFEGNGGLAELQDDIARGVMVELEPELTRAEIESVRRLRPENVTAWGHYQQGQGAVAHKGWTEAAIQEARAELRKAFELDPDFAQALALFALLTAIARTTGLLPQTPALEAEAREAAERAIAMDDGSTTVLGYAGCALSDLGHFERGTEVLLRALEIDPSNAQAHVALGASYGLMGRVDDALERMRHGMRISPRDRRLGFWGWVYAHMLRRSGRLEEALREARTSAGRDPRLHLSRILEAALLVELGRAGEARVALDAARRIRPGMTLQETALSHGRHIAVRLEAVWGEA